jgi:hypothetical protein
MANKKPVTAWKKGIASPNPAGRPPKTIALSEKLRERVDPVKLADALLTAAYSGDVAALKAVFDRLEWRPRECIDLNTGGELETKLIAILGGSR